MTKYCKYDESRSYLCRWIGECTPEDCTNCQLFTIKVTLSRILRTLEKAPEEVLKRERAEGNK